MDRSALDSDVAMGLAIDLKTGELSFQVSVCGCEHCNVALRVCVDLQGCEDWGQPLSQ